jgi:hypothetical protein
MLERYELSLIGPTSTEQVGYSLQNLMHSYRNIFLLMLINLMILELS